MTKAQRKKAQRLASKNATVEEWSAFYKKITIEAGKRVDSYFKSLDIA